MFAFKKKYYFIIENTKDINLSNIKLRNKINIIYRNKNKVININRLLKFREHCKAKRIGFYVSNNNKLALSLKADGLYLSANNNSLKFSQLNNVKYNIIGSAHNIKELNIKKLQGCSKIFLSRLFRTSYRYKKGYLGVVKYNLFNLFRKEDVIPLGGIRLHNLNKLRMVNCSSIALLSEIKKKPAKIINRLF